MSPRSSSRGWRGVASDEASLREVFSYYDRDGSGSVNKGELICILSDLGVLDGLHPAHPEPAHLTRARRPRDPREDDVAHVARALDALRDAGERMGEELDRQAAHVDDIARRAEHLRDRVDRANRRG